MFEFMEKYEAIYFIKIIKEIPNNNEDHSDF